MNRQGPHRVPLEQRFPLYVEKTATCWEWTGAKHPSGYGSIGVHTGKSEYAHRVSYELHVGPIPNGMVVRHACDNRGCVNPDHLSVGTHADNVQDAEARGGFEKKLTAAEVIEMRTLFAGGARVVDVADQYGVSRTTASKVKHRKTHRYAEAGR